MRKKILMMLLTLCLATLLCACQKTDDNNEVQSEENVAVENEVTEQESEVPDNEESKEIQQQSGEDEKQENQNKETAKENDVESTVYALEEYLDSVKRRDPSVLIWDEELSRGFSVEEDGKYEVNKSNRLFLYIPPGLEYDWITNFSTDEIEIGEEFLGNCLELHIPLEDNGKYKYSIAVVLGDGTALMNHFELVVVENKTNSDIKVQTKNEWTTSDSMSEWLDSITLEEPSVVIWDEETLSGIYVQNGEHYEIDEYNKFFLYVPYGMSFDKITHSSMYKIETGEVVSYTCLELLVPLESENPCEIGVVASDGTTYTQEFTLFMAR